jgi:hypothetical protein
MLNIHDLNTAYETAIGHSTSDSTVCNLLHRRVGAVESGASRREAADWLDVSPS